MSLCPSGLLMSALTLTIILFDLYNLQMDYVFTHSILGFIICILFFTMCNYGLEMVNWILLGFIPGYILLNWIFSKKEDNHQHTYESSCEDSCKIPRDTCKIPRDTCKIPRDICKIPRDTCKDSIESKNPYNNINKSLSCPAKPITLGTKCGVSRFT